MSVVKVLARGWVLEIQNPDSLAWVKINGIKQLGFDGAKNDADTTSFDNEGWNTHLVASRSRSVSAEGFYLEDKVTKARDPGQALCDALSDKIGVESMGQFRLTSPGGNVRNFEASASVGGLGGGNDDPTGWKVDLTCSGQVAMSTVAVTAIDVTPATLSLTKGQVTDPLAVAFTPANSTNKTLTFASSDATKAAVTPEGRVIGVATGTATITITAVGGSAITDTVAVTVS